MIRQRQLLTYLVVLAIAACGDDENRSPSAQNATVNVFEDASANGWLMGSDPEGGKLTYVLLDTPDHGAVQFDTNTGAFIYVPDADFFGTDSFSYSVSDGKKSSSAALVRLIVENVNDPPTLVSIPSLQNSAEQRDVTYQLVVGDIDSDRLTIDAVSANPAVAGVVADSSSNTITITPIDYGTSNITVTVSDESANTPSEFMFTVRDVSKSRSVATNPEQAIVLANQSDQMVTFTLTHNDFPMFQSDEEMVEYVRNMSPLYDSEPFENKLWRFVRDNVYHAVPLSAEQWLYDPWVTVNSLGWGLCGHVAAVYVRLARTAGYEARVWGLTGHVVPEVLIDGRWTMFDPDLAVYYRGPDGMPAGVEALAADPTLIVSPVNPIYGQNSFPYLFSYSSAVADFYGSAGNNFVGNRIFLAPEPSRYQPVSLPPGATLTYPGRWVDSVMGVDDIVPFPVPYFIQAALTIEAGWSGDVPIPWMLWDIQGTGRVEIGGTEFEVGSGTLGQTLRPGGRQIESARVVEATTPLTFVFFLNAVRYAPAPSALLSLKGRDVWAISAGTTELPPERRAPSLSSGTQKPRPDDVR